MNDTKCMNVTLADLLVGSEYSNQKCSKQNCYRNAIFSKATQSVAPVLESKNSVVIFTFKSNQGNEPSFDIKSKPKIDPTDFVAYILVLYEHGLDYLLRILI